MNLRINEIFYSIQGESTYAGKPCIFIRLTWCNLRCTWCDSEYAFYDGQDMSIQSILENINKYDCNLVEVTGGEPLMQDGCIELLETLLKNKYEVMLETGGSLPVNKVPDSVKKIVDFKCPGSGMNKKNLWTIIDDLTEKDEIKFVIKDQGDFVWAESKISELDLDQKFSVLLSPVFGELEYDELADWVLKSPREIQLQVQLHKHIWSPEMTGV